MYFSQFWGLRNPRSSCWQFGVWWEPSSWFAKSCLLSVSSHMEKKGHFSFVPFMRTFTPSWGLRSHDLSPKGLTSKYHYFGTRVSTYQVWRVASVQATAVCTPAFCSMVRHAEACSTPSSNSLRVWFWENSDEEWLNLKPWVLLLVRKQLESI